MGSQSQSVRVLSGLCQQQLFCVLATQEDGQPYSNLVAFVATDDLRDIVFATIRGTRKHRNMAADPRVALLIDSRSNQGSDIRSAAAATALGKVEEVVGADRQLLLELYLAKHPHLSHFASLPDCALMRVRVDRYYVVSDFQDVTELVMPR